MDDSTNILKDYCDKLLVVTHQIGEITINNEDNYGFMLRAYLDKQMDHMDSLIKLFPKNDMQLISRSMIEGYCFVKWAGMDDERSLKWRTFIYVHNYRTLKHQEQKGITVNPKLKRDTDEKLQQYAHLFKKKNVKEGQDPYYKSWKCTTTITAIANEVKANILYDSIYSSFSDWQHWGPASMSTMIDKFSDGYGYNPEHGSKLAKTSFAVGFQCLYQVISMLCEHFADQLKNINVNLTQLFNEYKDYNEAHIINNSRTRS
jgi:hypothetical protein